MSTYHKTAIDTFLASIQNDPYQLAIFEDYRQKLSTGFFDKTDEKYTSFVFQNWLNGYDINDACAFAFIHERIYSGKILTCDLDVGTMPSSDKIMPYRCAEIEARLNRLADNLTGIKAPRFDLSITCGTGDFDGILCWDGDLFFNRHDPVCRINTDVVVHGKSFIPIEIGYTASSRTFLHLFKESGSLARFPYGSEIIRIFINEDVVAPGLLDL